MQIQTFACVVAGLLAVSCTFQAVVQADDEPDKLKTMAETLKILQNLDKYYAQVARPSPRSVGGSSDLRYLTDVQEAVHKVRLRELDRKYLQRTRPRFGKRGDYPRYQEQILNGEEIQLPEQRLWDRLVR